MTRWFGGYSSALALENSNFTLFYNFKKSLYHYTIPFYNTSSIPNFYFPLLLIKIIYTKSNNLHSNHRLHRDQSLQPKTLIARTSLSHHHRDPIIDPDPHRHHDLRSSLIYADPKPKINTQLRHVDPKSKINTQIQNLRSTPRSTQINTQLCHAQINPNPKPITHNPRPTMPIHHLTHDTLIRANHTHIRANPSKQTTLRERKGRGRKRERRGGQS